jgi:hypothetical protein
MASFLKRTANASFVPRLLSIGPSMSASVYRGLRGCNLRCRGRITRHSYRAPLTPLSECNKTRFVSNRLADTVEMDMSPREHADAPRRFRRLGGSP